MKSIHTFDVFAPTDEQEEAMNKKRGGHYRRGKNKEMDYFIECATSLFPNNHYSRFTPIYDTTKEFYQLITSSDTTERAILNWIASNRAWNYLFGLLRHYYRTGHHDDNYIFPEFKIGSAYVADYLLIGNSSDGYQFVFVELEAPNGRITKEKGTRFGEVINKGIEQVRDWQMYIAANWNVIVAELEKHSFSNTKLPRQLYKYCPYQIYYAVIAGLRKDFENIRDRKLQLQNENNITLLHYENLIDVANEKLKSPFSAFRLTCLFLLYLFQTVAHTRELPFVRTGSASRGMGNGRRIVTPPARSLYHHLFKGIVGKQGHASSSSCSSSESPSPSSSS